MACRRSGWRQSEPGAGRLSEPVCVCYERLSNMKELENYSESEEWQDYARLMEERPRYFNGTGEPRIVKDIRIVSKFVKATGHRIGVVYRSPYNILVVDLVRESDGRLHTYERMLPAVENGAVVTVPVFDGKFVLLDQYRHSVQDNLLAFPRGYGEEGISPEDNVAKELREEIGAQQVSEVRHLGCIIADSGVAGTCAQVYACEVSDVSMTGTEGITGILLLTEDQLREQIRGKAISDGFTVAAFEMYLENK